MDVVFIIVLFVVISIFDQLASRKKRRLPPQNCDDQPNFDIPTLANDSNLPGEEIPLVVEVPRPAEIRPLNPPRTSRAETQFVREEQSADIDVDFTPSAIVNGFILSELLDKPKALRKRRR